MTNNDWHQLLIDTIKQNERLGRALLGLKKGGDGLCWCDVSIGNPMCAGQHTTACINAGRALLGQELLPPKGVTNG